MKSLPVLIPVLIAGLGGGALVAFFRTPPVSLEVRVPSADGGGERAIMGKGVFTPGAGTPSALPGAWPCFRGPNRDNICTDPVPLADKWPAGGPRPLWSIPMGEGYASPAVLNGRAYVLDYDRKNKSDVLRCLSLDTGEDIWRYSYGVEVLRNHGMSRTVPAVTDKYVVSLGPKCHVLCLDSQRGAMRWTIDLVGQYGTKVPQWYAGQCPLIDEGAAILAPAGRVLLIAVDCETGRVLWQTPNPRAWQMSHASVTPMEFAGRKMYVYSANEGTVGVDARDGRLLWETDANWGAPTYWGIKPSVVPSPVVLPEGRIFLCGGYNAGSKMIRLKEAGGRLVPELVFSLPAEAAGSEHFGVEQQTPVFYEGYLYGIRRPADELVCMDLAGKVKWTSGERRFGLGPLLIAGGMIYAMDDNGLLSLVRATPEKYEPLAEAKVLSGPDSWGPLVIVAGRLLARDMNNMVCLDVGRKP